MNNTPMFDKSRLDTMLEARSYQALMRDLDELSPIDAAEYFASLPPEKLPVVFRLLKKDTAAAIFAELDTDQQAMLIAGMNDREISAMLDDLFTDDAVNMLE